MIKLYIAGHNGMVGNSLLNCFNKDSKYKILKKSRSQLDLTDYEKTKKFFKQNQPDYVIIAAAKVGGILSNSNYPVEFLLDNLKIQNNFQIFSKMQNRYPTVVSLTNKAGTRPTMRP